MCSIRKKINLENLTYWNVDLQEPYYSYREATEKEKFRTKISLISIDYATISIDLVF